MEGRKKGGLLLRGGGGRGRKGRGGKRRGGGGKGGRKGRERRGGKLVGPPIIFMWRPLCSLTVTALLRTTHSVIMRTNKLCKLHNGQN